MSEDIENFAQDINECFKTVKAFISHLMEADKVSAPGESHVGDPNRNCAPSTESGQGGRYIGYRSRGQL